MLLVLETTNGDAGLVGYSYSSCEQYDIYDTLGFGALDSYDTVTVGSIAGSLGACPPFLMVITEEDVHIDTVIHIGLWHSAQRALPVTNAGDPVGVDSLPLYVHDLSLRAPATSRGARNRGADVHRVRSQLDT